MIRPIIFSVICSALVTGTGSYYYNTYITDEVTKISRQLNTSNRLRVQAYAEFNQVIAGLETQINSQTSQEEIADIRRVIDYQVNNLTEANTKTKDELISLVDEAVSEVFEIKQRLTNVDNTNSSLQNSIDSLLEEISKIREEMSEEEEEDIITPTIDTTENIGQPRILKAEEPPRNCSYAINNKSQTNTKIIQRAVDRTRKKGSYSITVYFSTDSEGVPTITSVESNDAPGNLERATQKYVARLKFGTEDKIPTNCKMNFTLKVV